MNSSTKKIVYAAAIAAIYAALTMINPLSYGNIQFRVSEVLCILPFFVPFSAWGLACGCFLANILGPYGPLDAVVGTAATLLAALCTAAVGKGYARPAAFDASGRLAGWGSCIAACAMPVLFNGLIIGAELAWLTAPEGAFWGTFALFAAEVAAGEAAVLFVIGLPLMRFVMSNKRLRDFFVSLN